ncbi:MAG: hypothetical protein RBT80_19450 [Candidatus Vecturithrix sp.]|nr:hypothetical protein [Candidatus Vecturithrix sp.]
MSFLMCYGNTIGKNRLVWSLDYQVYGYKQPNASFQRPCQRPNRKYGRYRTTMSFMSGQLC